MIEFETKPIYVLIFSIDAPLLISPIVLIPKP